MNNLRSIIIFPVESFLNCEEKFSSWLKLLISKKELSLPSIYLGIRPLGLIIFE